MEKPFNEKESLALIHSMIAGTRTNLRENSVFYLLWGWTVFLTALAHYVLLLLENPWSFVVWPIAMPLAGMVSILMGRKQEREAVVKTHLDRALNYLWGGFTVVLFIALGASVKFGFEITYPILIWLYGLGTFVSGGMLRFQPLVWGGVVAWLLGILAILLPFEQQLLCVAGAILFSYIIPGHLLRRAPDA